IKSIPVIERPSIIDASNLNHAWVKAIEELQGVEHPARGQYLRCLLNEMNRIMSHLYWLSIYGVFLGHTTMFMWPLGDRELFIDLAESLTGARITYSYLVPGGVRRDLPQGFEEEAIKRTEYFEKRLDEYENIFFKNPLFTSRAKGVGVLSRQRAIELGTTGPTLRGSGVDADLRKDEPYAAYGELDFKVHTRPDGDSYSRAMVHMDEMRESCQLIRQILKKMPSGPVRRMAPIVGKARDAVNSLLAYTTGLRHLFHKPYTLKFPQQRYAVEKGFRGRHLLHLDRCTGCGICAWICPEKCITIVQRGDRWFPEYFYGRCCFCHFCVTPDTMVTTNPSIRPISQIQSGDRVLTHTGQYRPVRQVITRNYSGRLYSIRPLGTPSPLRVTEDHPLLVSTRSVVKKGRLQKKPGRLEWKTPKELKKGDYVTFPIPKETHDIDFY